jgi:predicted O-methyltransferase YrrM
MNKLTKQKLEEALQLGDKKYYEDFDLNTYGDTLEPGSMPADGLYEYWMQESKPSLVIEVGSFLGYSAIKMAKEIQRLGLDTKIICIDTWLGSPEHYSMHKGDMKDNRLGYKHGYPTMYYKFISNVIRHGVHDIIQPFPFPSSVAFKALDKLFKDLDIKADFIFVDGSHEEHDVSLDLYYYYQLLKDGGQLWGDDWAWEGVQTAAKNFVVENNLQSQLKLLQNNVHWFIQK